MLNVSLSKNEIEELITILTDACDAIDDQLCDRGDDPTEEDTVNLNSQLDFYCNLLSKLRKAKKGKRR